MGKPLIGGFDPTGMTGRPPHRSDGDEGGTIIHCTGN